MIELTNDEIQQVELGILRKIASLCDELGLDYFLTYGTLLGAVRHGGFIPWDDDLDVMMKRSDCDKLVNYFIAHEDELMPFKLFSPKNNSDYPFMIPRICDMRYRYIGNNEIDCGMGVFVDIYPLDGAGKTWREVELKGPVYRLTSSMCYLASRQHFFVDHVEYSSRKNVAKTVVKFPLYLISKALGKKFFFKRLEGFSRRHPYSECDYVGPTTWQSDYRRDVWKKVLVGSTVLHEFDGERFKVPVGYKEILTQKYGDYMKLPPVENRVATHDYRAYLLEEGEV